jgi:hypothetical protein
LPLNSPLWKILVYIFTVPQITDVIAIQYSTTRHIPSYFKWGREGGSEKEAVNAVSRFEVRGSSARFILEAELEAAPRVLRAASEAGTRGPIAGVDELGARGTSAERI